MAEISHKEDILSARYSDYINIILLPPGFELSVDFKHYKITTPSLLFVSPNQVLQFHHSGEESGQLIYYNRDFYCIQIHDAEVACDGLLFNNLFQIPIVMLQTDEAIRFNALFGHISEELRHPAGSGEEMIRTFLKQIIILATRQWKKQHLSVADTAIPANDEEFFRNFSRLVEIHFREKHSVADYAEMMHLAPKTLSHKFNKLGLENPNEMIKNRIVLEAKRLLLYTDLSVKEIAYQLGYDDPAYFNRLFTQRSSASPAAFRKQIRI